MMEVGTDKVEDLTCIYLFSECNQFSYLLTENGTRTHDMLSCYRAAPIRTTQATCTETNEPLIHKCVLLNSDKKFIDSICRQAFCTVFIWSHLEIRFASGRLNLMSNVIGRKIWMAKNVSWLMQRTVERDSNDWNLYENESETLPQNYICNLFGLISLHINIMELEPIQFILTCDLISLQQQHWIREFSVDSIK